MLLGPPSLVGLDAVDHPGLLALRERCDIIDGSKELDAEAWHRARAGGLGGSDTGSVLGLNPYRSEFKLWLQKTGQAKDDDLSGKESIDWGNILEEIVARRLAAITGWVMLDPQCTFVLKAAPQLRANPDRLALLPDGSLVVVECKTADWRLEDHWRNDRSPSWYEAQAAHYCAVLGLVDARLACLIGGNKFVVRDPELTADLIEAIADQETSWWARHVIEGNPPAVDGEKTTTDVLTRMWEKAKGTEQLDESDLRWIVAYRAALVDEKDVKARKTEAGNNLRNRLGEKEIGEYDGVTVVTWKNTASQDEIDWDKVWSDAAMAAKMDVDDYKDSVTTPGAPDGGRRLNVSRSAAALRVVPALADITELPPDTPLQEAV